MILFNDFLNNDLIFYGMFIGVACHLSFSFLNSIWGDNKEYTNAEVQTEAWEEYSDRLSQMTSPGSSPVEHINVGLQTNPNAAEVGIQTITSGSSEATTILPIPPVNIEIIPNPDIVIKIIEYINLGCDYIDRADALTHMMLGF